MLTDNLVTIGKLTRVHGVEGKAVIVFEEWAYEKLKKSEWVFLNINRLPVPFFIVGLDMLTATSAIIQLESINTVEQMRSHVNREVLIVWHGKKKPVIPKTITGYDVIDEKNKKLGKISEVSDFNGNIVACVKGDQGELWIPLNDTTIQQVNHRKQSIQVVLPEGLIDLYQ